MSKKKKSKKKEKSLIKLWNVNSKNVKILESGKIKFKKNEKIDISSFVDTSVTDSRISRLEGIPTNEEIIIDGNQTYRIEASANCSSIPRIIDLVGSIDTTNIQTILIPMTKKKALHLEENPTLEWLAKTSTFIAAYTQLKKPWIELNEDDGSCFTNVMFIPKIYIFLEKNGKVRKTPVVVNLLITAVPSISKAKSGIEETDKFEYTNRIINDSIDAAIRCGCKSIVTEPFAINTLKHDVHYTARYWYGKTETQRVIENIRNITFSIDNDELYVIFCKNKQPM